jgi:gliding motility-associated-like protein
LDAQNPGASYLWSTGDTTQFLLAASPGQYSVTVSTNCGTAADTILIGTGDNIPPEVSIIGPRSFCPGATILLRAQANEFVNFQWATGETGAELSVSAPGLYQVSATDQCGASTVATAEIELLAPPQVQLLSPEALCPGEAGALEAISPNADNFQWSGGSILATATATGPGEYNLRVSNECGVFDTAWAIAARPLPEVAIRGDSTICPGEVKTLEAFAQETDELTWSNGQRGAEVTVARPGSYTVEARNGCGTATASILLQALGCPNCFYVPSAFSPNDDGRNDTFLPGMGCMAEGYRLQVFSRWGSLLFDADDPAQGWDGRFQGKPMPAGLYAWSLSYQLGREQFREAGEVLLLR